MTNREMAARAVEVLNRAFATDPTAIAMIFSMDNRVPCNRALADDSTIQVGTTDDGHDLGVLGLLNGICGTQLASEWGYISGCYAVECSTHGPHRPENKGLVSGDACAVSGCTWELGVGDLIGFKLLEERTK